MVEFHNELYDHSETTETLYDTAWGNGGETLEWSSLPRPQQRNLRM